MPLAVLPPTSQGGRRAVVLLIMAVAVMAFVQDLRPGERMLEAPERT